jgi:hypothetical protein
MLLEIVSALRDALYEMEQHAAVTSCYAIAAYIRRYAFG